MKEKQVGGGQGFVIEQGGPNGWSIIGAGGLIGVAMIIIALALWQLSAAAGTALIIVAVGQAGLNTCRGAALIIEARGRARAMEKREEAWRVAVMRGKLAPGPKAREDIEELWGKNADR